MAQPLLKARAPDNPRRLPAWARRSHPLVRRHLGIQHTTPLEIRPILRLLLWQAALIGASLLLPLLGHGYLSVLVTSIVLLPIAVLFYGGMMASIILLPAALALYGWLLFDIGMHAAGTILNERQKDTLLLLRTTPFSLPEIFLSKIAASIWRQTGTLNLILRAAAVLSLPFVFVEHIMLLPSAQYPFLARLGIVIGLVVSLLRLLLEPLMAGALGILAGTLAAFHIPAAIGTAAVMSAYFLLINLIRLLPLSLPQRLLIEWALPLLGPLLVTWAALQVAAAILRRD